MSIDFGMHEIRRLCFAYNKICERLPYILDYDYRDPRTINKYEQIRALERELCGIADTKTDSVGNDSYSKSMSESDSHEMTESNELEKLPP